MALKEWARKKNRELHRQALEDRDSRLWHSHAYHRYFEGYTEYKETDANGRERLRRVYTSPWQVQALPASRRVLLRCLYILLFLLMIGAVVLAGIRQTGLGTAFYVVIPELAVLCLLSWLGYVLLVNYLFLPEKMTLHEYRASSVSIKRAALAAGIAFLCSAVMCLLEGAISASFTQALLPGALFLAGAACALILRFIEQRVPYREEENKQWAKSSGIPIEGEK